MDKRDNFLKFFGEVDLPKNLQERIVLTIRKSENSANRRKAFLFSFLAMMSVSLTMFVTISVFETFIQSGFYHYLSVVFLGENVLSYWKELMFSLVESLPIVGVISVLVGATISLWTVANSVSSIKRVVFVA